LRRNNPDGLARLAFFQLALMAVVVAAFVVDTLVGIQARNVISADVAAIAGDAIPSVQYLTRSRGLVRKEAVVLRQSANAALGHGSKPAETLDDLREDLDATLASYHALPYFSGEPAFFGEVQAQKQAFERAAADTLAAAASGDRRAIESSIETSLDANDRLDAALERLVQLNAAQGQRLGFRIESERHAIDLHTLLVDIAVAALAMAAMVIAAIGWRRSAAALKERASELDMFAGRVAHDVLSPLMAVGMGLSLSEARLEGDGAAVAVIRRATRSLERVRALVADLLDFARAGASPELGKASEVGEGLREVLEGSQDEAREAHIDLRCETCPDSRVVCPRGVLMSLAQNLVRNAIKYMGDSPRREVTVRAHESGSLVHVAVEDTGPGVPEELRAKVFEPFVRGTHAVAGVGMGLATVKKLAEAYGGHVGCRSAPRGGSIFWFELPRAAVTLRPATTASA
jgi:signal transduction histidine kinase